MCQYVLTGRASPLEGTEANRLVLLTAGGLADTMGIEATMPPESLGKKLQDIRKSGGVSGKDLAKELGIDHTLLSHYETGRRAMPLGFYTQYIAAVQAIVRRRAIAVGIMRPTKEDTKPSPPEE